jgi:hypothetical protein
MLGTGIIIDGMVLKFRAKFVPDTQSSSYIYFDTESSGGVPCTEKQNRQFITDFSQKLHKAIKLMWLWLLLAIPTLAALEVSNVIPSHRAIEVAVILLPAPLLYAFVYPTYSAPRVLTRQSVKIRSKRSREEIIDARVLGINPATSFMLILVCVGGFILTNYGDWHLIFTNRYNLIYLAGFILSLYTLWRRNEAVKRYRAALSGQKLRK